MSPKVEKLISKARKQIESRGWVVQETPGPEQGKVHLEFTRNGERKGWGMFNRVFCWTMAFEAITGKSWLILAEDKQP